MLKMVRLPRSMRFLIMVPLLLLAMGRVLAKQSQVGHSVLFRNETNVAFQVDDQLILREPDEEETLDLHDNLVNCYAAMKAATTYPNDSGGKMFASQFATFIRLMSGDPTMESFRDLKMEFVSIFYSQACLQCAGQTGCCVGGTAAIDVSSTAPNLESTIHFVCASVNYQVGLLYPSAIEPTHTLVSEEQVVEAPSRWSLHSESRSTNQTSPPAMMNVSGTLSVTLMPSSVPTSVEAASEPTIDKTKGPSGRKTAKVSPPAASPSVSICQSGASLS